MIKVLVFPNGMTIDEGVARAGKWWDETGREIVGRLGEEPENTGGLMAGALFDNLSIQEKHKITVNWYHNIGEKL